MGEKKHKYLVFAILGLAAEALCVPVFLLGSAVSFFLPAALLLWLAAALMPFLGVAFGIVSVTLGRKDSVTLALGIVDLVLPALAALLAIVMFSTGVWTIRFM